VVKKFAQNEYRSEYCELVKEVFGSGGSMADFCVKIGHGRKMVYQWIDRYPSTFGKAYEMARELGKVYRDNTLKANLYVTNDPQGENFNAALYHKMTAPRFKDMESETPNLKLFKKTQNLMGAMQRIMELTASGQLDVQQSRALSELLTTTMKIKEQEVILKKIEELERLAAAATTNGASKIAEKPIYDAVAESTDDLSPE